MKKYEAIYQDLLNMIESHKIKAGELLPSEFHLRDYYKASRDTVRKALMMLSQNGYIQKSAGFSIFYACGTAKPPFYIISLLQKFMKIF